MDRSLPAVLTALLLVASLAAGASAISSLDGPAYAREPVQGTTENTSRVLRLDTIQAGGFERPNFVLTSSLAAGGSELERRYEKEVFAVRYEQARTDEQRRAILQNATNYIAEETSKLRTREQQLRESYARGDISGQAYLTELAVLHARANHLSNVVDWTFSQIPLTHPLYPTLLHQQSELAPLQGPVRARLLNSIQGEQEPKRVFVAVSGNGVRLAMITDGQYIHESFRADNVDSRMNGKNATQVRDRILELYPYAFGNAPSTSFSGLGQDRYRFEATYDHGQLSGHFDVSTNLVYREVQRKVLAGVPTTQAASVSENNVTLAASRSYPGGPLRIAVTNATGAGLAAPVSVNGTAVGRTGPDGVIWTLGPRGTYNVSATYNETDLTLNVTAVTDD